MGLPMRICYPVTCGHYEMRAEKSRVMRAGPLHRQRRVRHWHRWVAMVTSCQLLLWTLSGLYFAFIDIDYVRGHQFKAAPESTQFDLSLLQVTGISASKIVITSDAPMRRYWASIATTKLSGATIRGALLLPLSGDEALAVGTAGTVMSLDRFEWVDREVAGSEYRGAPLAAVAALESPPDPDRVAYLDAMSG